MYYTGIGSRDTPEDVLKRMNKLAKIMRKKGWVLRTGDAEGADKAFREGSGVQCEIYTAYNQIPLWTNLFVEHFHPNPKALSPFAYKLMARNSLQILGDDGDMLSELVVCWTKDGKDSGGTGQAIRIAEFYDVPVYNFKNEKDVEALKEVVSKL